MGDYYPLISRAIAALDKKSSEARREIYDRARAALADQLQKVDPPLSETNLEHERSALEDAIGKVEADAMLSELKWPIPDSLQTQSNDGNAGTNSQQTQPTVGDVFATMQVSSGPANAEQQRERHFGFWVFLSFSVLAAITVLLFLIYLKK
jgi:hypothetical protein